MTGLPPPVEVEQPTKIRAEHLDTEYNDLLFVRHDCSTHRTTNGRRPRTVRRSQTHTHTLTRPLCPCMYDIRVSHAAAIQCRCFSGHLDAVASERPIRASASLQALRMRLYGLTPSPEIRGPDSRSPLVDTSLVEWEQLLPTTSERAKGENVNESHGVTVAEVPD